MIRSVAIDDEPRALGIIREFADQIPFLKIEASCSDSVEVWSIIENVEPDLLFLDIEMPEVTGIELLKKMSVTPYVIFTTAYSKYAVEGFNLNAIDYLLKPYGFKRFLKAVERARETIELKRLVGDKSEENDCVFVKSDYQNHKINLSDILYIEAMDNYIKIYTASKIHITLMNLKGIMKMLPPDRFARVHRSYIVSLSKIDAYNRNHVICGKQDAACR
jgi:DNA-binding LytR/AlgR family response regulator